MSVSMEERLKRRKLDALKRGVHRVGGGEAVPVATHIVGIGKAGAGVIAETLRHLEPGGPKLSALAIDIGEQDLASLRTLAKEIPADRAAVTIVSLDVPTRVDLLQTLEDYPSFMELEYPRYHGNANYRSWLPQNIDVPKSGDHCRRAVAKAIYGRAYYDGPRSMQCTLRNFAASIDAEKAQAVVLVVFGLDGGTGSGIAVDLARHLSNGIFGRRVLVAGVGIAPCDGDGGKQGCLFPVLNELDCLGDETKNNGVVMSCGELFRNPFTAGFILVPQQHVWEATKDLGATHKRVDEEIACLVTARSGANLWELLRLLNWVAAPSTQHSAARTPWGRRWIHMLGFADKTIDPNLPRQLGLLPNYRPEFIEVRSADPGSVDAATLAEQINQVLLPDVAPQVVGGGREGSVQFVLPCISKLDLSIFRASRAAYDVEEWADKLLDHSLLLEQGVLLCEPSTRLAGMAGASLAGTEGWVAVPFSDLRGEDGPPRRPEPVVQLERAG